MSTNLQARLRLAYQRLAEAWYTSRQAKAKPLPRHASEKVTAIFTKAAVICREQRFEPEPYALIAFRTAQNGATRVAPSEHCLIKPEAVEAYENQYLEAVEEVRRAVQHEVEAFEIEYQELEDFVATDAYRKKHPDKRWSTQRLAKAILVKPNVELSPLMRYCLALKFGLHSLAAEYEEMATKQYDMFPQGYDSQCREFLPLSLNLRKQRLRKLTT